MSAALLDHLRNISESVTDLDSLHDAVQIKREIQQREDDIANILRLFNETRADLLRKLNAMEASTRSLPPEILAHIFSFVRSYRDLLKLGGICSHWRQITLSTPRLWAFLALYIPLGPGTGGRRQNIMNLLQFYLHNVKDVPFSLMLWFPAPGFASYLLPKKILNPLSSLLLREENARKVHSLKLKNAPSEWISSISKFPNIVAFETCDLAASRGGTLTLPLINTPGLRHLALRGVPSLHLAPNNVEYEQVTRICLERVAADAAVSLLMRCPNLIEFRLLCPIPPGLQSVDSDPTDGLLGAPIVLLRLEHLSLSFATDHYLIPLYSRLHLPALRVFRWRSGGPTQFYNKPLQTLLPQFPSTLSLLEIRHADGWSKSLVKFVLSHATAVENLRLDHCDYTTVINMITALGGQWIGGRRSTCLPKLRNITVNGIIVPDNASDNTVAESEAKMAALVVKILRHRCRNPAARFSLEMRKCSGIWTRNMWAAYRLLKGEGIEMRLLPETEVGEELQPDEIQTKREIYESGGRSGWD